MEIGEGLMDKRANEHRGVELVVRCVNDRTCFVALPRLVASALTAAGSAIPLPLAVSPRANWAGRKESRTRSSEPRVGSGHQSVTAAKSTQVKDASRNSEVATPRFTAWAGAVGSDGAIELSLALADCLGLVDGQPVLVVGLPGSPIATAVVSISQSPHTVSLIAHTRLTLLFTISGRVARNAKRLGAGHRARELVGTHRAFASRNRRGGPGVSVLAGRGFIEWRGAWRGDSFTRHPRVPEKRMRRREVGAANGTASRAVGRDAAGGGVRCGFGWDSSWCNWCDWCDCYDCYDWYVRS
jgi:hypothetical protein